jgi:spermidine/putrescine transport system substrate-binding protein
MPSRRTVIAAAGLIGLGAAGYFVLRSRASAINLLAWSGYEEQDFLADFEQKSGARVNVRTYSNADQMVSILLASPGQFDLVVVDPEYIQTLVGKGAIQEIDYGKLDLKAYFGFFQDHPLTKVDGKHYAVPIRFGVNALVFNTELVAAADTASYDVLFKPDLGGKIGVWDWYLPNMGVISRSLGNTEPYDISDEQLGMLTARLAKLRPAVGSIHASLPDLVQALVDRRVALAPGVGEFVAAAAVARGAPISWSVPKEGGIMWVETMAICAGTRQQELALQFLDWVTTPEAQASLAQRRAYNSNTPNRLAYQLLPTAQKQLLHAQTADDTEALIKRLSIRRLPVRQQPQVWQADWRTFKA